MATQPAAQPPVGTTTTPPHRPGRVRRAVDVIDERLGITALEYPVPEHANNVAWSLGGVTAFAFGLLVVTGVLLVQFYAPVPEAANQSVRDLSSQVWGMRFVRGLHYWAAQAMYVTAALHLLRVFFTGSYKRPREGNWLVGVAMFGLVIFGLFTGTVLKWDQEGFEALGHNLELAGLLGGAGLWFSADFANTVPILVRLYGAHVVMIPGLILVLLTLHGLLVKRHRISPHPALPADESGDQAPPAEPTEPFTHHLRRIAAFGLVLTGLLGVVAVLWPPSVGPRPVTGIEVTRPPWTFWWMFTLENWVGLSGILYGGGVLFLLLIILPFVDRNRNRHWRRRPVAMALGLLVLLTIATLTVLMLFTTAETHL
ncbi:MAG TPA: cytochrome b N-terminal domain-containing protein [Intrasporangium sp.]|uniref:cytochrome b N-terminal domain-containing protein n=1 Tax=Intrasporangium sp. TaxID=1925024 RepID=UPI002D776DDF|nr:cytochrome b N-terminal domain-containing protein [Intrasporangium sp.]HET7399393.1 cytochrome b N-terminal domain-containing protein [Intrasporangium sp.]